MRAWALRTSSAAPISAKRAEASWKQRRAAAAPPRPWKTRPSSRSHSATPRGLSRSVKLCRLWRSRLSAASGVSFTDSTFGSVDPSKLNFDNSTISSTANFTGTTWGKDNASFTIKNWKAEPDAWFSYYYWLDDARAPDFARTVDIHRKPGYDPCELFMTSKFRAMRKLLQKKLGFRYRMDVIPLDGRLVRGSHGLRPADPDDGAVIIGPDPPDEMTQVKDYIRRLLNK